MSNDTETPIDKTIILRIINDELHVSSSEDLSPVYIAGMLYKALEAVHFMLTDVDNSTPDMVH